MTLFVFFLFVAFLGILLLFFLFFVCFRKPKVKKPPTVKPIKASDKKTLESAIAMANALASKSMHELDKRTTDHFYDSSPGLSPLTPNSPTKKFSFWFPTPGGHHQSHLHRYVNLPGFFYILLKLKIW